MLRADPATEEPIRRWPVKVARRLNRFIGWTDMYCSGGCGYPITGRFSHQLEVIDGRPVVMSICSLGGQCERDAATDPRDDDGRSYADFRPGLVEKIRENPDLAILRLWLSR